LRIIVLLFFGISTTIYVVLLIIFLGSSQILIPKSSEVNQLAGVNTLENKSIILLSYSFIASLLLAVLIPHIHFGLLPLFVGRITQSILLYSTFKSDNVFEGLSIFTFFLFWDFFVSLHSHSLLFNVFSSSTSIQNKCG
jgi:hypothetical protein